MNARRDIAARMAETAVELVASLSPDQRDLAMWPFPSDEERQRWNYTPTDHGGLTLGSMTSAQQQLAMRLVATGLSRSAYVAAATIIGLENVLDELEGWKAGAKPNRRRDPSRYYLRVFGTPADDSTWSWRFGGHHVSVNQLIVDGMMSASTPCFLGANPAAAPLLGPHLLRPLAAVEDLGRELVRSLDEAQRVIAVVSAVAPADIVSGNRPRAIDDTAGDLRDDGRLGREQVQALRLTADPKGLPAHALQPAQTEVLRALLDTYVGRIPDDLADVEAAKFAGGTINNLAFAWAGGIEPGEPHYYRIQGPRLLAEYDNTQDGANHIHSVWRDPEGDFGNDVLATHYRRAH